MTFSTDRRVASRTLAAPLMTRETVPTPTPDAAATSAIVARRVADMVTLLYELDGTGSTENEIIVLRAIHAVKSSLPARYAGFTPRHCLGHARKLRH